MRSLWSAALLFSSVVATTTMTSPSPSTSTQSPALPQLGSRCTKGTPTSTINEASTMTTPLISRRRTMDDMPHSAMISPKVKASSA